MKTTLLNLKNAILIIALLFYCHTKAQESCGFDNSLMEKNISEDKNYSVGSHLKSAQATVWDIPIVIHVINLGEPIGTGTNISDAQILQAIQHANDLFKGVNGVSVDMEINFCLAVRDPNGNPTTGINRVNGSAVPYYASNGISADYETGACDNYTQVKDLSKWPTSSYLNIWVVNRFCIAGGGNYGGYASYGGPAGLAYSGITIRCDNMVSTKVHLAHELGHMMGLDHTFGSYSGSTCPPIETSCTTQGDRVCDTPPHRADDWGPTNPCSSVGVWANSRYNIVSYNRDATYNSSTQRFTQGQKDKARSSTPSRHPGFFTSLACTPPSPISAPAVPTGLTINSITTTSAVADWNDTPGATSYTLQYRIGAGVWTTVNSNVSNYSITGLTPGTTYEVHVLASNSVGSSVYNSSTTFTTISVGYCAASGKNFSYMWVAGVTLNGSIKTSSSSAYSNFTSTTFSATSGATMNLILTPGTSLAPTSYPVNWKVWIDYNGDKDFNDAGENVFSSSGATSLAPASSNITFPSGVIATKMRVAMSYGGSVSNGGAVPTPCGTVPYGEVEDYTINISQPAAAVPCVASSNYFNYLWIAGVTVNGVSKSSAGTTYSNFTSTVFNVTAGAYTNITLNPGTSLAPNPYPVNWKVWIDYNNDGDYTEANENVVSGSSTNLVSSTQNITIASGYTGITRMRVAMSYGGLVSNGGAIPTPCGTFYHGEVEDYTINILTAPTLILQGTSEEPSVDNATNVLTTLVVFPNPASTTLNYSINLQANEAIQSIEAIDILGKYVIRLNANQIPQNQINIDSNIPSGIYHLRVITDKGQYMKKFSILK